MAKILSIHELRETMWPEWLQDAFGENLVSAFLHGDCLMEGFNPFKEHWLMSFTLHDDSPGAISQIQGLLRQAEKDKLDFGYFFTQNFYDTAADTFPLELLHISQRNVPIIGESPLSGFVPDRRALRLQCERELRGALIRLTSIFAYRTRKRTSLDFFLEAEKMLLPTLYGIRFLETNEYPSTKDSVYRAYPFLKLDPPGSTDEVVSARAGDYIVELKQILAHVDKMEV